MNKIKIFDTTLRDGEQSPGCSMNIEEKISVAKQLEKLGVDVIEAGFAAASKGDFEAVKKVAESVENVTVTSLARALKKDINLAWEAVKGAKNPRIHTFIATSDIHMKYKLKKSPEEVYRQAVEMVKYAKTLCRDVEFSCEDATRTREDFLYEIIEGVIEAGATVINVPDTVGYTTPEEFYKIISGIKKNVKNIGRVDISVHCHNDLGLAVANSLSAIKAGATQVECTVNGIGERAGNAALEELVMTVNTRKDIFEVETNIETTEIYRTSQLISKITGVNVQPNKAIVGKNAFAHESGIHQHGMLSHEKTYEIMSPESIGISKNKLVLGKHSGKHAFLSYLKEIGYDLADEKVTLIFEKFKNLADKKKTVEKEDIIALINDGIKIKSSEYEFKNYVINSSETESPVVTINLTKNSESLSYSATGDGPIDAAFKAIAKVTDANLKLDKFAINAVTNGTDAQGEVLARLKNETSEYNGKGLSTDIFEASILAYVDAINNYIYEQKGRDSYEGESKAS